MSSSKKVNNNIMNSNYSIFSQIMCNDSDSGEELVFKNKNEPLKEEIKDEKPKYTVKKFSKPSDNKNTNEETGWTSVGTGKTKKYVKKEKYVKNNYSNVSKNNDNNANNTNNTTNDSEELNFMEHKNVEEKIESIVNMDDMEKEMREIKFQNKWYIWMHEIDSKDWSAKSYKIIQTIESLWDFWQFFNFTQTLNQWKFNFFIMKSTSHPTWEHSTNRNGGTCSIRIDISQSVEIIEQLAILLVNESLTEEINDINGISFAAKGNWCVIKIWNRDYKNNISNQIPSYLRKIYPAISIKYKENIPEY